MAGKLESRDVKVKGPSHKVNAQHWHWKLCCFVGAVSQLTEFWPRALPGCQKFPRSLSWKFHAFIIQELILPNQMALLARMGCHSTIFLFFFRLSILIDWYIMSTIRERTYISLENSDDRCLLFEILVWCCHAWERNVLESSGSAQIFFLFELQHEVPYQ